MAFLAFRSRLAAVGVFALASFAAASAQTPPVNLTGFWNGTAALLTVPAPVSAIVAGDIHSCLVTSRGGVSCWGYNHGGQLGDGTDVTRMSPVPVTGMSSGVTAVAGGYAHTCAVTQVGGLACWGFNANGQLGDGTQTSRFTAGPVSGLASGVTAITLGYDFTCAVVSGGVRCWGNNSYGQLGDGTSVARLCGSRRMYYDALPLPAKRVSPADRLFPM